MDTADDEMATSDTFAEALDSLKREGCLLLTTGAGEGPLRAACRRLAGDAVSSPRERLYVLTRSVGTDRAAHGPAGGRTIRYETETRSTATATPATAEGPSIGSGGDADRVVNDGLEALFTTIAEEVKATGAATDGFQPAELRLCVDSLADLLATHGEEEVFNFLHEVGGLARQESAMCHVHLPTRMDDETAGLVGPLFDAIIEVREGPQQRWHLRDPDMTTEWLSL
ncbi:MAG: hypothetical protein ABEJ35_05110 [Halobacteriaceae archaeon]